MKRVPMLVAGLAMLALLAAACGGAAPAATSPPPAAGGDESLPGQETAAQPQLLYFYADW
jgi:hypothetical protein